MKLEAFPYVHDQKYAEPDDEQTAFIGVLQIQMVKKTADKTTFYQEVYII
jgi:hypothetical protein